MLDLFLDLLLPKSSIDFSSLHVSSLDQAAFDSSLSPQIDSPASDLIISPLVCRSSRVTRPHSYLQDYHCHLLTHKLPPDTHSLYPLSHYASYSTFLESHRNFLLHVSNFEPQYYHQAMPYAHKRKAMKAKLDAMHLNHTLTTTILPQDKHAIRCKWIYKIKYKAGGFIERHKVCLVVKGYTQ